MLMGTLQLHTLEWRFFGKIIIINVAASQQYGNVNMEEQTRCLIADTSDRDNKTNTQLLYTTRQEHFQRRTKTADITI